MGSQATRPQLLNLILVCFYFLPESNANRASGALISRAIRPRPHRTTQTTHHTTHFANTRACGARFVVAAIVLLGSPPVPWLIWNLVMFFED
jgi:hypothetical protein